MRDVVTTLHYPLRPEWGARMRDLNADGPSTAALVRRLVAAAAECKVMVLNGFGREDRLAAAVIARRRRPPRVVFTDCTWELGRRRVDRIATRTAIRAIDGTHVVYCVLSGDERERFPSTWRVDRDRVRVVRWYHALSDEELARDPAEDGPIFAGGRSMRDYRALLEIAPALPAPVRIAATAKAAPGAAGVANVEVGELPHPEFMDLMRRAKLVVVPVEDRFERSAGQNTFLNAMAFGKTVVVTDTTGVRDYIEHRRTGLLVRPNDPRELREAIEWALDPANAAEVAAMRRRAREVARERFGPENYIAELFALADELLGERVAS